MNYSYKTKPFKHQLEALARSAGKRNFAYFMEMGCVDEETEFLTTAGWLKFKDFDPNNLQRRLLVAQAIPESPDKDLTRWSFEFVEPISYIKKLAYDWYEFFPAKTQASMIPPKFVMTADHVLPFIYTWGNGTKGVYTTHAIPMPDATAKYIDQCKTSDPDRKPKYPTRDLNLGFRYITRCTNGLRGFDSEHFEPDPDLARLNEWELRFMVAAAADGTFPNKTDNKCDFYFTKKRKAERLMMLAQRAGIPLAFDTKKRVVFNKNKDDKIYIFHAMAPMKSKIFDERWYTLNYQQLRTVVSEVFYWDGYQGDFSSNFYTVHKDSADFIQYALMACGWEATITYNLNKRLYDVSARLSKCSDKSLCHETKYADRPETIDDKTRGLMVKYNKYSDEKMSYCFRVPSGYLILRRNNRIFISGNSGKTKVMIDNIGVLHTKGHISGVLVMAPKGVYRNWSEKEIPAHLPDEINREILVWDAASSQSKKDKLQKQVRDWDGKTLQFLVFNIESLISEKGRKLIVDFIKRHDGNVFALVDESTCIKNHKAKRTKAAIDIGQKCKVRRIATGSPITNSPLDLYAQCAFLDKSLLGCGSYYSFKNTYADFEKIQNRQGQHYEKILRYKNLDRLSNLLDNFSYRVTKKECLDLPDKIYITRDVDLTPEQEKIYLDMYNHQFALLYKDNKFEEMSVQVILTKLLRLHQVLCGTFTSDDGTTYPIVNNRIEALKEVLQETSGKVIIWATYLENIYAIVNMLKEEYGPDSFVTYFGETSADDRVKAINLFQDENSPVRFFVGNTRTAGRGITLTAASTVIYYSNDFSLELRQQSEDRAHRMGQKNNVTYIDLVVRNSLDEKIIKSLIEKRNIANEILKDDLEKWISLKPRVE